MEACKSKSLLKQYAACLIRILFEKTFLAFPHQLWTVFFVVKKNPEPKWKINFDKIDVHSWESIPTSERSLNINLEENGSFWPIACRSMGKFRNKVRGGKPQRREKVENCRVRCVTRN